METVNPEIPQIQSKAQKTSKKTSLSKPIQYINNNQLNTSHSKMQYSFPKSERFNNSVNSFSPNKFYELPPVLKTQRSSSFGYGKKVDFSKNGTLTPAPGNYEILRQFEGNSSKGSTMGLSRQLINFNNLFNTQATKSNFPEPASYKISYKSYSPRITIGEKFTQKKKWIDFVPGPGNYQHQEPTSHLKSTISNFRSSPTAKFGKTQRLKQIKQTNKLTPGPGNYNTNQTTIKKDGTTFSRSQRPQLGAVKGMIPGPGAYEAFSTFLH